MTDLNLSARAYDRILKVGRTIGELAGSPTLPTDHVSETSATGFWADGRLLHV